MSQQIDPRFYSAAVQRSLATSLSGVTTSTTFATSNVAYFTTTPEAYEVVDFGFGIRRWRNKQTGFLRAPSEQIAD